MSFQGLFCFRCSGVGVITMDSPPVNSLGTELVTSFKQEKNENPRDFSEKIDIPKYCQKVFFFEIWVAMLVGDLFWRERKTSQKHPQKFEKGLQKAKQTSLPQNRWRRKNLLQVPWNFFGGTVWVFSFRKCNLAHLRLALFPQLLWFWRDFTCNPLKSLTSGRGPRGCHGNIITT